MSFDAGEIIAKLKLERTQFDLDLDEEKAKVDEKFGKPFEVEIKPVLDDVAMEEVLAEEEPLRKDIEPEVKPTYAKSEAEQVGKTLASDILTGVESDFSGGSGNGIGSSPISGLLKAMLGEGLTREEMASALKNLGFNKGEIDSALLAAFGDTTGGGKTSSAGLADSIAKSILPSSSEMDTAIARQLGLGQYSSLFADIEQRMANDIGTGGGGNFSGQSPVDSIVKQLFAHGVSKKEMPGVLASMGKTADQVAAMMDAEFGKAVADGSGGNGGFLSKMVTAMFGGGGSNKLQSMLAAPFDAMTANGGMGVIFNPVGAAAGTAFLGAFGLAISGGLAGIAIGMAGTLSALIPGYLDLTKGLAAYTALQSGGSTKGMSSGQLGLGAALQGLLGAGSKGLGSAEATIMPEITKFVDALTKAAPLMNKFAGPAVKAMSSFFDVIDKGLGSKAFGKFMTDMGKLVGPIMTQFGQVIINLGTAFGGFLKLFGGVGATQIGPWFVKITGELSHFLNHVKLGHGFVNGMVTVFSNLGKVLGAVWPLLLKLGEALAPIGLQVFRIAGWMAMWIGRAVKLVPPNLLTAILGIVIGMKGLSVILFTIAKAVDIAKIAMVGFGQVTDFLAANPIVLIIAGIVALGLAIYEIHKHWKVIWADIKRVTLDAWHFLDNKIFHPIADYFSKRLATDLNDFKKLWGAVWGAIKTVAMDTWKFLYGKILKPWLDFYKLEFTVALTAFKIVWNTVWDALKFTVTTVWNFIDNKIFKPLSAFFTVVLKDAITVFKKIWDGVWSGIQTSVQAVWKVISPIFDAISSAISTITSGISSVTGLAGKLGGGLVGGITGFIKHPFGLAAGGPIGANEMHLVGEKGPELFVPSTSGTIVPNGAFGGSKQQIIIQVDARGHSNPQQVAQAARNGVVATLPSLRAALARGAA